jgi:DNA-binding SARP family transcriptional activator
VPANDSVPRLTFAILGPLEARDRGRAVRLGPFKQRVVLGLLLCRANQVVSVAELSEALWGGAPPRSARKAIQVHVCALRGLLDADRSGRPDAAGGPALLHSPPGYVMRIGSDRLDALRMRELTRSGRRAARQGDLDTAADLLGQAVRLWRGEVLPDLVSVDGLAVEAEQLREQYLATYEDWADAVLALGNHADVVDGIDDLVRRHPFRERLRHAQMLALHRAGRSAEALARFDEVRQLFARELGLPPSPVLDRLHRSMLSADEGLEVAGGDRVVLARPAAERRTGLPPEPADLVGRQRDAARLLETLASAQPGAATVVTGAVGVGKTALALHCAHRLEHRFPDGRFHVSLRDGDGNVRPAPAVLADLLRTLGVTGRLPDDHQGLAALLRWATRGHRALVIVDDVATEAEARSVLAATGDAVVLLISRRHLGGLESAVHIGLGPIADAESLLLLDRRVGGGRVAAEPAAARRLTAICRGRPLLVHIVGSKLDALRHLTLDRYARRLADDGRMLDELDAGDLRLRSRLAVAYRDLTGEERTTLHALARLPAPVFTASDAAGPLGTSAVRAELMIERLVQAHVVEVRAEEVTAHGAGDAIRYELPSVVGLFARQVDGGAVGSSG